MEEVVIVLLKLLVQLVLYAFTGKWHRFGNADDQPSPPVTKRPQEPGQPPRAAEVLADLRDPVAAREALRKAIAERPESSLARGAAARDGGTRAETQAPWLFEFPDEYVEFEPDSEETGGEALTRRPTFSGPRRVPPPPPQQLPVGGRPRSLASALRDRQTLRNAVVLGAAFAPRGTRGLTLGP